MYVRIFGSHVEDHLYGPVIRAEIGDAGWSVAMRGADETITDGTYQVHPDDVDKHGARIYGRMAHFSRVDKGTILIHTDAEIEILSETGNILATYRPLVAPPVDRV